MKKTESQIQAEIRKAVGRLDDFRVWRNNTGQIKDSRGIPVRFGLCEGSSDLIGILAPQGRLVALEVKTARGEPTKEQKMFLDLIRSMGGFACIVRSDDGALRAIERARKGMDR